MPSDLPLTKYEGAILGLAIGDALGFPTEFLSVRQIHTRYGPDGVTDFEPAAGHPLGTYTDDTQMSVAVAEALIDAGHRSLDELMQVMATGFVEWARSPDNNRAPGNTCMAGCRNLQLGITWREAGIADSKGCGSAMRTAPIGLYLWQDEQRLTEVARASSMLTHRHPTALAAAAATALLVSWALRGDDPQDYPEHLIRAMRAMDGGEEVAALARRVPQLLPWEADEVLSVGQLGEAWVGDEAVASALYCFCRTPHDYQQTVLTAANTAGDSDSIACIAGAISGAFNGIEAIPRHWRECVENTSYLVDLAHRLFEAAS